MPPSLDVLLEELDAESRSMAHAIVKRRPDLVGSLEADPEAPKRLRLHLPSPTGDPGRDVLVWMDDEEPSLSFGPWHTHATVWAHFAEPEQQDVHLAALLDDVLEDRVVLCFDVGGPHDGFCTLLDLRESNAVEDALTDPASPGRVRLASWGGTKDCERSVETGPT